MESYINITSSERFWNFMPSYELQLNKAGYLTTLVARGGAGAVLEKLTRASGQEQYAQKAQKRQKK